ncbi:MAG: four helix bundle protein [Terriglobia bacterium]
MAIVRFEQLEVWQAAHKLVLDIYKKTQKFPTEEKFGLVSQMRRAAVSIPANIAEGFKRRGRADKGHFYNIAQASLEELRYYLILCCDLGYSAADGQVSERADKVSRMLYGLVQSLEVKPHTAPQ